jgi:hypothetical protein
VGSGFHICIACCYCVYVVPRTVEAVRNRILELPYAFCKNSPNRSIPGPPQQSNGSVALITQKLNAPDALNVRGEISFLIFAVIVGLFRIAFSGLPPTVHSSS